MSATIHDLLGQLRSASLDERDKGDKFERLIQAYFRTDPEWTARFDDVWLWSDWPGRAGVTDIGIDLVASNKDRDDFTAIQCKFYAPGHKVAKSDIDSFLALTMRPDFWISQRIVVDTASGWSGNAEEALKGVAQRIDIGYLDNAAIDWADYRWTAPERVVVAEKKRLRPHQTRALEDVRRGLVDRDRGKLIMACGTGKTFTSLRIAEDLVGEGGRVLFLVPSIQLLSQSLQEWMTNREVEIRPFAVCSDVRVGRRTNSDDADMSTIDLTEPATTDAAKLLERMSVGKYAKERMTVVFSTYQSIDVIIEAQQQGLGEFDLVICDEAHRTTGVTLSGQAESAFVKVHDASKLRAKKRLYMTATPRVFGDAVTKKAVEAGAVLADMGDESTFGPELHRLGFGQAVEANLLTDYKVVVLAVDERYVAEKFQQAMSESGEIKLDQAAKLIGCWKGLSKSFGDSVDTADHTSPMRTAVAFAQTINASQQAAQAFPTMVDRALLDLPEGLPRLSVEAQHVDGTMGIHERNAHLSWLKATTPDNVCRILTNARCLSEGVDVPALDAVLFLTPRGSQVDVVQSVGRVMRKAPGKDLGYIILPVVVPAVIAPEDALRDNERYKVVWQVLQALRSHDERFHAMVNQIELNKTRPDRLQVISVTNPVDTDADGSSGATTSPESVQTILEFPSDEFREAMYARIVQKVGERKYWETWAGDVAEIAQTHITRINGLLADPDSPPAREFEAFLEGLRGNLNESISRDEAIEMLAQHLITRPVFEALFAGYDFSANPVAQTMELMLASLDEHNLEAEQAQLDSFYDSVRRRVAGVEDAAGKQRVIIELYDNFFAKAFKRTVDRLGIVYTPIEIVDFILNSADQVLRAEFGQGLTDEGVHILDGFTGTGTFITRLLTSGLIKSHDLARKYAEELHANEMLLLAYYIAAVNIETTYADLVGAPGYQPFPGLVLTDTFQSYEDGDRDDLAIFPANNERIERQRKLPITVIVGNPPYSVGQDSANDDAANLKYPTIDAAIRDTYAARSTATNKNSLYDSYIRAIKWASLRIKDRGVIAFVTNGGWLDANTADGMRLWLAEEFSSIHIFNLRGNARTAGEQRRKEGGTVFDSGSRATVAITILVKKPDQAVDPSATPGEEGAQRPSRNQAIIHYTDIGDYLSREEKLAKVASAGGLAGVQPAAITPNEHGDWLKQRAEDFAEFMSVGDKGEPSVFSLYSGGLKTNRDAWCYGSTHRGVESQMRLLLDTYSADVSRGMRTEDTRSISWNRSLIADFERAKTHPFRESAIVPATYRPFTKAHVYFDRGLNDMVYRLPRIFPTAGHDNLGFYLLGLGATKDFSALSISLLPDLNFYGSEGGQFFPRYTWEPIESDDGTLDFGDAHGPSPEIVDGYRRVDNITDHALATWQAAYGSEWPEFNKDDLFFYCYGLLHSPDYRERYAADLKKMLPRIPLVATTQDARAFADAGRRLSDLHIGYESVPPYPLQGLDTEVSGDPYDFYAVGDKKMRFGVSSGSTSEGPRASGARERDRTTIHYNDRITLRGIPEAAYRYLLGSRSAIEWIIDRYYIKTDKASGIVNNPNDWSREVGDPRYILDLLARVVTVSLETMKVVDALPVLDIAQGE